MPTKPEKPAKKTSTIEFLIVSVPEKAEVGATFRLLGVKKSLSAAENSVSKLGSGTLGRVAVLELKALFVRRPAVENIKVNSAIGAA